MHPRPQHSGAWADAKLQAAHGWTEARQINACADIVVRHRFSAYLYAASTSKGSWHRRQSNQQAWPAISCWCVTVVPEKPHILLEGSQRVSLPWRCVVIYLQCRLA